MCLAARFCRVFMCKSPPRGHLDAPGAAFVAELAELYPVGTFLAYRYVRTSPYNRELPRGCAMKALLPVFAGIAVVTSSMSVVLWRDLRTARQANTELRTQLTEARSVALTPAAVAPVVANPEPAAAAATVAASTSSAPASAPVRPASQSTAAMIENSMNLERDLMKNPEYRKLRLAQTRVNMERNYPGLAEELGLSEKEADRLFDLLAEHQTAMSAESQLIGLNGTQDQAAVQEMIRRQQAMQREQEESIRNMLGGKYSQWQEYQQTRPARSRVTSMGSQLAQAGMPLTEAQTKALTSAMIAEQQRQRQDALLTARSQPINPADPDARARALEETMKRTEENNRRTLEAAAPHLNARQLAALREQNEQQAAMLRISMQMQAERERLQPQGQSQGISVLQSIPIVTTP